MLRDWERSLASIIEVAVRSVKGVEVWCSTVAGVGSVSRAWWTKLRQSISWGRRRVAGVDAVEGREVVFVESLVPFSLGVSLEGASGAGFGDGGEASWRR